MLKLGLCLLFVATAQTALLCRGSPRRHNGKSCASTTQYHDHFKGACGCGTGSGTGTAFPWNQNLNTVGANSFLFDTKGGSWCGTSCGKCVKLCPTGGFIDDLGAAPSELDCQTFMITNDCPVLKNERWCGQHAAPSTGHFNSLGYEAHFVVEDNDHLSTLGWNSSEVTWEFADCSGINTPNATNWHQCECAK